VPAPSEPLSEYLFCRRTPFTGEGLIITSAILTSRELLRQVPFNALPRLVDVDWLLRASRVEGAGVEFVPEPGPLLVWHIERRRPRMTNVKDWRFALSYVRENSALFTPRGHAAYILHVVSSSAAAEGAWGACLPLIREAFRCGAPSAVDVLSHLGNFLMSEGLRRRVSARFARQRDSRGASHQLPRDRQPPLGAARDGP
jgi:hypothetical protein